MQERAGKARLWLTVIMPFAMGFFIAMVFKCVNAILAHPLMQDLHLSNVEMGGITSVFMLTLGLAQLPLGVLLDSWGPRKTQSLLFVIGAVGITVFGLASDVTMLAVGRAILGVGMAGGLMAALKAVADWCSAEDIPFYNSIIMGAGGLGALMATTPSKFFELEFGWRPLCFVMAALTLAVAAVIFFAGRDKPGLTGGKLDLRSAVAGLKEVYTDRFFWQVAPLLIVCNGGFIAMLGLWLGPWLQHVVGFSPLESAHHLLAISLAVTIGFASGSLYARLAERLGQPVVVVVVSGIAVYIAIQVLLALNVVSQNYVIWAGYGLFAKAAMLGYAVIAQHFGPKLSGRASTGANIFVCLFAFATQYVFGVVLHYWPDSSGTSQPVAGYQAAFSGLIVLHVLALAWFLYAARTARASAGNGRSRAQQN